MQINPQARKDSYKDGHFLFYRDGIEYLSSYIEARGVEQGRDWKEVVFAGSEGYVAEYLDKPLVTKDTLQRMHARTQMHGTPYNFEMWSYILDQYGGYAPVRYQALPEGTVVPLRTPLVQIVNTDRKCSALTSWLETTALRSIW